jgi:glycine reductase complex component B subunit alpha and beta
VRLEVGKLHVRELVWGSATRLDGQTLVVDAEAVRELARREGAVADVALEVAYPGDSARILHVLDALPAMVKVAGPGGVFPGFLADPIPSGHGRLHRLENFAVLTCGELSWQGGGLFIAREGLVDMCGPGQELSPFGHTINLVLRLRFAPEASSVEQEAAARKVGLDVAAYLGEALATAEPDELTLYATPDAPDLPRVVYIDQVHSMGQHAHTYLYGWEMDGILATVIHPNELLEGALVSGNLLYASFKTPTWLHCRNAVLEQLYAGHGREHVLAGVVLSRGHHYTARDKQRSGTYAAHLAQLLRADGVVLTWEGGGNSITDAMLTIRACERLGIKTAAIAYEMAAEDAADVLLLDSVPEANALVSTGSTKRGVMLPRVERVLGGDELRLRWEVGGIRVPGEGPLALETLQELYCAAGQTGFGRLAGVAS